MTTAKEKQNTLPGVELPDGVREGILSQLRKLRMAETRQATTLDETRKQIEALEALI